MRYSGNGEQLVCNTSTASDKAQKLRVILKPACLSLSKMSATRYRRFLKLCEEWPRDESKKGRDLGTFLRQRVAAAFREGESTQISDPEKCDQIYESLARINGNVYRQKFPRVRDTSFTGVTVEECKVFLTGSATQMDEQKKGLWKTLMQRFSSKPEDVPEKSPEK
uniref:Mitochondrial nucleoid factor 1 n=2 Tax=Sphaeramia orbicularis TaxID=375764 RepID=A0A672YPN4_9TELE